MTLRFNNSHIIHVRYGEVPFGLFPFRQLPLRQLPSRQFPFRQPDENSKIPFPIRYLSYALFSDTYSFSESVSQSVGFSYSSPVSGLLQEVHFVCQASAVMVTDPDL